MYNSMKSIYVATAMSYFIFFISFLRRSGIGCAGEAEADVIAAVHFFLMNKATADFFLKSVLVYGHLRI